MSWVRAVAGLRASRTPGVLVTVAAVRGHAPREVGAKMVVSAEQAWGSVGGGNLEQTATARARALLAAAVTDTETLEVSLSDKARAGHGRQCCGGEVTLLLEPLPVVPSVAVFGLGHVGLELARLLSRHDLDLHLVDSRADHAAAVRAHPALADAVAEVHVHHAPLPEVALGEVPRGTHVLVLTHDHAEDFALCDAALRMPDHLASVGVIGSTAKWRRFEKGLRVEGHDHAAIAAIRCPIGPVGAGSRAKTPASIALGVVAEILDVVVAREDARR